MTKGLVSIITPCYNTGHVVHRLLNSLLIQDYPFVEIFVVDDGSTDNTKDVISSYIEKFKYKNYKFEYLYQENQGQSAAINTGLRYVNGEYLIWPDSDDFFKTSNAITTFVKTLSEADEDVAVARCPCVYLDERTLCEVKETQLIPQYFEERQFRNCLLSEDFFWGAGNYMVKMVALDECIQNRHIFAEKKAGQNRQILAPIMYKYKCITITDILYNVLLRSDSHSRGQFKSFDEIIDKTNSLENTCYYILDAVKGISSQEKTYFENKVKLKYLKEKFMKALRFSRYKFAFSMFIKLRKLDNSVTSSYLLKMLLKSIFHRI